MKILIIGGTHFVGRQILEMAVAAGHEVSICHRGKTNAELFPSIRRFIGDRNHLDQIIPPKENWDLAFDTCGYHPQNVQISADLLRDRVRKYVFISSVSVYTDLFQSGLDESSRTGSLENIPDLQTAVTASNYGGLKVLCENVVQERFSDRALILRPTIIVGTHDDSARFDFWIKNIVQPMGAGHSRRRTRSDSIYRRSRARGICNRGWRKAQWYLQLCRPA